MMNSFKKWEKDFEIIEDMRRGSEGSLWGHKLEQADHFPLLKSLLDEVGHDGLLIDLGCGAGDLSRVWSGQYLGADLDWILEEVAKKCNPAAEFMKFDVFNDDIKDLPPSKAIIMNALLDVIEDPITILRKVCQADTDFVVVHRQKIVETKDDKVEIGLSYGNSKVPVSKITIREMQEIVDDLSRNKEVYIKKWNGDYYSFTIRVR